MTASFSSTLVNLSIEVETFDDCLYLLDERLNNLCTLKIDIEDIDISVFDVDNMVKEKSTGKKSLTFVYF
jgi:hypothetical protein